MLTTLARVAFFYTSGRFAYHESVMHILTRTESEVMENLVTRYVPREAPVRITTISLDSLILTVVWVG